MPIIPYNFFNLNFKILHIVSNSRVLQNTNFLNLILKQFIIIIILYMLLNINYYRFLELIVDKYVKIIPEKKY